MRGASIRTHGQLYREWRITEYAGFETYEVVDYTDCGNTRTVLYRTTGHDASGRAHDWLFDHPKADVPIHPPQQGPWPTQRYITGPYMGATWTGD